MSTGPQSWLRAVAAACLLTAGALTKAAPAPLPAASMAAPATPAFSQALAPVPFNFPHDHGPHPGFRQEWWYFTGNLDGAHGERFGFELTFFRVALAPNASHAGWRAQQFYFAHLAVTDAGQKSFHSAQRFTRDALDLAGANASPFHVWLQSWSVEEEAASTAPRWHLIAADGDYALNLHLAVGAAVLNGDRGFSRKSGQPGSASFYYSIPRLAVTGSITRGATEIPVTGLAWLDREWGSGALGPDEEGWDWFALQLEDGSSLMYYRLRDRGGAADSNSAGTWVETDGVSSPLGATSVAIASQSSWTSPRGGRYPASWHLQLPAKGLELDVQPVLSDQELATIPRYWEGAVDVRGTRGGRLIGGRGYVELVGYARDRE